MTTILLLLAGSAIAGAGVIIFAPCTFSAEFSLSPGGRSGRFLMQWLHPGIAKLTYDLRSRKADFRVFGWDTGVSRESAAGASADASETGTPSAAVVQGGTRGLSGGPKVPQTERRTPDGTGNPGSGYGAPSRHTAGHRPATDEPYRRGLVPWRRFARTLRIIYRSRAMGKTLRWCARVASHCLRLVRFDHCRLAARCGAGDPAVTGKIYGWFLAVDNALLRSRQGIDVRFEPLFGQNEVYVEGSIAFRSSLGRLSGPFFVAVCTFPYLTAFLLWRRLRKIRNETAAG